MMNTETEIRKILAEIDQIEFQDAETAGLLTIRREGRLHSPFRPFAFEPAFRDWPMVVAFHPLAHAWEVEHRETGIHWTHDENVEWTDIDVQVYKNGWVIWCPDHETMLAVNRPDIVERIRAVT